MQDEFGIGFRHEIAHRRGGPPVSALLLPPVFNGQAGIYDINHVIYISKTTIKRNLPV